MEAFDKIVYSPFFEKLIKSCSVKIAEIDASIDFNQTLIQLVKLHA